MCAPANFCVLCHYIGPGRLTGLTDASSENVKGRLQVTPPCRMLESKMVEAKSKKDTLKARAKTAQTSRQIADMVQGLNTSNAVTAFERMEEKVMSLEAEADATLQVSLAQTPVPAHYPQQCRLHARSQSATTLTAVNSSVLAGELSVTLEVWHVHVSALTLRMC